MLLQVSTSRNMNIDCIPFMGIPLIAVSSRALPPALDTLQLEVNFKARDLFADYLSVQGGIRNAAVLGCGDAAIDDFLGCATRWTSGLRHTVLRAARNAASGLA